MTRPLDVRLTEYRDGLLTTATQLEALLGRMPKPKTPSQVEARAGLQAAVDIYRIIAGEDLTKVLAGEELKQFVIYGEVPNG